eukprot:TRINITY_DN9126_c0_g1_i5.p1 TRINITY_DN9126_c0_g1~~TRINITY_DN9126_c0_g1_i5.p1  ORF type:complete len:325 (-),score=40.53 TRINITY_DN9126_c0_g1_i5:74-1015(-)
MRAPLSASLLILFAFLFWSACGSAPTSVYTSGEGGYSCFRIPDLLRLSSGSLLAFAEARKLNCGDHGWVDLVVKASHDGGATWTNLTVVYSNSTSSVHTTIGNAVPMQERVTNRVIVPFCTNNSQLHFSYSDDGGVRWSPPLPMPGVVSGSWEWVASGPPAGVQLSSGRLLFVINHHTKQEPTDGRISVVYSDDHGKTWQIGGTSSGTATPNESQPVEIDGGVLFITSRSNSSYRYQTVSRDGGITLEETVISKGLVEPDGGCEGSVVYLPQSKQLFFSGPGSTSARQNMTLFVSKDQGSSWSFYKTIDPQVC